MSGGTDGVDAAGASQEVYGLCGADLREEAFAWLSSVASTVWDGALGGGVISWDGAGFSVEAEIVVRFAAASAARRPAFV